ncbi:Methyl-accepting chemotaxis protein [Pseudomonas putida]|nr:Methyl-accepting chemotaxis protein [Pseudomonas putida]
MDPTDLGPGTATWLGGTSTVLLGGFLWLRKWLSEMQPTAQWIPPTSALSGA